MPDLMWQIVAIYHQRTQPVWVLIELGHRE